MRKSVQYKKGTSIVERHIVSGVRRKPAVSEMSHLQYVQRKCVVPAGSHLQYGENFVQCEERIYSVRTATYAVGGEGVWFEEKVSSIRNVTSAVQEEKVCNTKILASAV